MTEDAILRSALAQPPTERDRFLLEMCCGDDELLARLRTMLVDSARTSGARPPSSNPTMAYESSIRDPEESLSPGTMIAGRFKLLECLGEGGMGTVYVAEQVEPVRRKVALKLIKPGMDSRSVLARFEAERQALAMMDHPNIARVFDGGLTEHHRPYFVMEFIKGVPLTQYCDHARLSIPDRLKLFMAVCQGIQHAHQKGIIHRDLKPTNILVGLYDGRPVPKVIDFGLAKAMHQPLTDRSLYTGHDTLLGTPLYMSPEQSDLNNLDVDTRTDIYSLGVILYELLTGTTPLDRQRLYRAAFDEMVRIIRQEEPAKPSTKLSSSAELPGVAANRQIEPARLSKLISGDLDWIVMKALEKDRGRRYASAYGFSRDIERFLADEPVEACPPSAGYRIRKFLHKHRSGVATAAALGVFLLVGTGVSLWLAIRATRAEQHARQVADAEREANALATKRLEQLERTNVILGSIFRDLDPRAEERGGPPLRMQIGQRLDQAAATLSGEAVGDPLTVARLQTTLGITHRRLGDSKKAIDLLRKALATREAQLGPDDPATLEVVHELAESERADGNVTTAVPHLERAYEKRKAVLGPDHPDTLTSMSQLASAYHQAGQRAKALPLQKEALEKQLRVLGPDHLETMSSANDLAMQYWAGGRMNEAIPLLEQLLKRQTDRYGPEHRDTLAVAANLARLYLDAARTDQGLKLYEQTVERFRKTLGDDHIDTLKSAAGLGLAYQQEGKLDKAQALQEALLAKSSAKLGDGHPNTLANMNNLAITYEKAGQFDKAIQLHKQTIERSEKALGRDNPDTLDSWCNLAGCYSAAKQYEQAVEAFDQVLPRLKTTLGPSSRESIRSMSALAFCLLELHQFDRAEAVLRECLNLREKTQPDHWSTYYTKAMLGRALDGRKQTAEAEPLLLAGIGGLKERYSRLPPVGQTRLRESLPWLIEHFEAANKSDEAANWRKELAALTASKP